MPAPIAIFFQGFMIPVIIRVFYLPTEGQLLFTPMFAKNCLCCLRYGDGHTPSVYDPGAEKVPDQE